VTYLDGPHDVHKVVTEVCGVLHTEGDRLHIILNQETLLGCVFVDHKTLNGCIKNFPRTGNNHFKVKFAVPLGDTSLRTEGDNLLVWCGVFELDDDDTSEGGGEHEAGHVLQHHRENHHVAPGHPGVEGPAAVPNCGHGLDAELEGGVEVVEPRDTAGPLDVLHVPEAALVRAHRADVPGEILDNEVDESKDKPAESEPDNEKPNDGEPVHVDAVVQTQGVRELQLPELDVETPILFYKPWFGL